MVLFLALARYQLAIYLAWAGCHQEYGSSGSVESLPMRHSPARETGCAQGRRRVAYVRCDGGLGAGLSKPRSCKIKYTRLRASLASLKSLVISASAASALHKRSSA